MKLNNEYPEAMKQQFWDGVEKQVCIYIYEYPGSQLKSAAQISTMSVIFLEIALGGNIWKSIRPGKSPSFMVSITHSSIIGYLKIRCPMVYHHVSP